MRKSLISTFLIGFVATTTWASDDDSGHGEHSEHGSMNHGEMGHGMMEDGIHTEVTVHRISDGTVNVSHGPILEIGWPAMTMDLSILDDAEIGDVEAGDDAMMMLEKGEDGMFAVRALMPVE